MATKKIYDLTVKTGEYQNNQGETKGRYLNVGAIMQKEDGGKFIFLNRTFNPAGVPNPDNRDNVILSMFKPKEFESAAPQVPTSGNSEEDNIPF